MPHNYAMPSTGRRKAWRRSADGISAAPVKGGRERTDPLGEHKPGQ
ncbi:MAG: hypothetical protein WAT53_05485 [Nitrosomonas sp.]